MRSPRRRRKPDRVLEALGRYSITLDLRERDNCLIHASGQIPDQPLRLGGKYIGLAARSMGLANDDAAAERVGSQSLALPEFEAAFAQRLAAGIASVAAARDARNSAAIDGDPDGMAATASTAPVLDLLDGAVNMGLGGCQRHGGRGTKGTCEDAQRRGG